MSILLRLKNICCFVFTLFFAINVNAQEKLIIRYKVGAYLLDSTQERQLINSIHNYSKNNIDSVITKGFADSLGDYKANLELSKNRAKEVMHFIKKTAKYPIKYKYYAAGEKNKRIEDSDRRVEIYFYAKENINDTIAEIIPAAKDKCVTTAYDVLGVSHNTVINKRKTDYVVVEIEAAHYSYHKRIKDSLYFAVVNKDSTFSFVKVKWRKRGSGVGSWAKTRYQIEVPKTSFDKYKLFYLTDLPCKPCGFIIGDSLNEPPKVDTCVKPDAFLSYNIQYRTSLFNKKTIEAKVPKEYVNLTYDYTYYNNGSRNKINWKTKPRRKDATYYFVTLPLTKQTENFKEYYRVPSISKSMPCCIRLDSFPYYRYLAYGGSMFVGGPIKIGAEIGAYHIQNNFIPYLGLGLYKENAKTQYNIMFGIDANKNVIGNLRYQYNYVTLPFELINPFAGWIAQSGNRVMQNNYFLRLYIGSSIVVGRLKQVGGFVMHDAHLGLSIASESKFINRLFVQYGYGYDYTNNLNKTFNPVLNYGIIFRLN